MKLFNNEMEKAILDKLNKGVKTIYVLIIALTKLALKYVALFFGSVAVIILAANIIEIYFPKKPDLSTTKRINAYIEKRPYFDGKVSIATLKNFKIEREGQFPDSSGNRYIGHYFRWKITEYFKFKGEERIDAFDHKEPNAALIRVDSISFTGISWSSNLDTINFLLSDASKSMHSHLIIGDLFVFRNNEETGNEWCDLGNSFLFAIAEYNQNESKYRYKFKFGND